MIKESNFIKKNKQINLIFKILFLFIFMGLFFYYAHAVDYTSTSFQLENPVTGIIEGGQSSSASFNYISSTGQLINGQTTSTNFLQNAGFLYFPEASSPVVTAVAGNSQVSLSWTAATGILANVTSYSVGVSSSSGGVYTYTDVGNVLSNTVTGLSNGTTYYFKIRSFAAGVLISESAVVSSTPVAPSGGGGGGGGGGGSSVVGTRVNFYGRAYPMSRVTILKDGVKVASTLADPLASFSVSVGNLTTGNYNFSVYGEDSTGKKSSSFTFPIYITTGTTINVAGIFLSPTIDVDKSIVKKGENIAIFGQSVPDSDITISVHSAEEIFNKVKTDSNGVYLLNFDTAPLEIGGHIAKSKSAIENEISPFGASVPFQVGLETKIKEAQDCSELRGDLNCDGKVNLVDFSIMAYWYKTGNPPSNIDLNNDTKITLVDFSIMAYNWTG